MTKISEKKKSKKKDKLLLYYRILTLIASMVLVRRYRKYR